MSNISAWEGTYMNFNELYTSDLFILLYSSILYKVQSAWPMESIT